jgi:Amidase
MNLEWGTSRLKFFFVGSLCLQEIFRSLNVHSIHGPVRNPFNLSTENSFDHERSPGGSSGGSAAAVAAGMCDAWVLSLVSSGRLAQIALVL